MKRRSFSPGIQKLVDQAHAAEKRKRAQRATPSAKPKRLSMSDFGLPPRPKRKKPKKAAKRRASSLRHPSLPADHPFNRPRRKKAAKKRATKQAATSQRKAPKRKTTTSSRKGKLTGAAKKRFVARMKAGRAKAAARKRKRSRAGKPRRMAQRARHAQDTRRARAGAIERADREEREARLDLLEAEESHPHLFDAAERRYAEALATQEAALDYPKPARSRRPGRARGRPFGLARAPGFRRVS